MKKQESIESRAVKIASAIMVNAGLCRYESATQCRRLTVSPSSCEGCLRRWLLTKAKKELEKEDAKC